MWIERALKTFYKEHVTPFANYPPEDRPSFSLLIGIHRRGLNTLFTTEKSVVRVCRDRDGYVAIGAGAFSARSLLRQFYGSEIDLIDLRTAEILAAYVVFRIKGSIGGCGGQTEMCRMDKEGVQFVNPRYIDALEQRFRDLERVERANFYYVVQGESYHGAVQLEQLDALQAKFADLAKIRDEWWLPPQDPLDATIR